MKKLFLARDKNGELNLYGNEPPMRNFDRWTTFSSDTFCVRIGNISQYEKDFPSITWEDKKPTEVMLVPCSSTIPTIKMKTFTTK